MTVAVNPENTTRLEADFRRFHAAHPEVYNELVALCHELMRRGYQKFGIATVYEVCRWRSMIQHSPDSQPFKLNNNHRAYYARMIMERNPDLRGVFATRKLGEPHHVA